MQSLRPVKRYQYKCQSSVQSFFMPPQVHLLPQVSLGLKYSQVQKQLHNAEMPGCVSPALLDFSLCQHCGITAASRLNVTGSNQHLPALPL